MKNGLLYLFVLIFLFNCKNENKPTPTDQTYEKKEVDQKKSPTKLKPSVNVNQIKTNEDKKLFLDNVFASDQNLRNSKTFNKALDFKQLAKKLRSGDSLNIAQVEAYFKTFGYPKKSEVGANAAQVPCKILEHAFTYEERERNFNFMYEGYANKDLDPKIFEIYLDRMHQVKFQSKFILPQDKEEADKIRLLIEKMGLK